jgi:ubiquinone/menaquinone biosynthesis C-methylase UbiE
MDRKEYWEGVYGTKPAMQVSWYTPHLEQSIAMIRTAADLSAEIIDVGGGASTLVDDLLALGYTIVSVLDVSNTALAVARNRLGTRAGIVKWIAGDVTSVHLPTNAYDMWHDRAVFHFLTEPEDRKAYANVASRSLKLGGHAILAAFSLEGPARCRRLSTVFSRGSNVPTFTAQRRVTKRGR